MKIKVILINGPNLNMLGKREPEKYGYRDFESFFEELSSAMPEIDFQYKQSNIEGELVTFIQEAGNDCDGIVINPGAYTHTSVAIADAIAMISVPVIEVHITNLLGREEFRHNSLTGRYCRGSIMGLGLDGYRLAAEALKNIVK